MATSKKKATTRRIFFALWPDDALRQQIAQHVWPVFNHPQGRKVPRQNWHMTLAFLGNVSEDEFACAQTQANNVDTKSFELVLDVIGHWSRPRVAWLGCEKKPAAIDELVNILNEQLAICGYTPEYKTFRPHMTLMRKVTRRPKSFTFQPITWQCHEFVLVESQLDHTGSVYKIIQRWPLC